MLLNPAPYFLDLHTLYSFVLFNMMFFLERAEWPLFTNHVEANAQLPKECSMATLLLDAKSRLEMDRVLSSILNVLAMPHEVDIGLKISSLRWASLQN